MKKVLITGAHGQLGMELNFLSSLLETHTFTFAARNDLRITHETEVTKTIESRYFDIILNAAAYAGVDKAEGEKKLAFKIKGDGPALLAKILNATSFSLSAL